MTAPLEPLGRSPDPELLSALRAGDPTALEAAFRAYYEELVRAARRLVSDPATAEDIVQDVFATLWEGRGGLTVRSSLRGYLHRATRNNALNVTRRQGIEARFRERAQADPSAMGAEMERVQEPTVELRLEAAERRRRVAAALAALSPRRREAMTLRWIEGLSYREIAEAMGIAPKSVENELARGMADLRDRLREAPPPGG